VVTRRPQKLRRQRVKLSDLSIEGVRRNPPDWDGYVKALLEYSLRKVERERHLTDLVRVLAAVREQKR
jgi:hypothetical protein